MGDPFVDWCVFFLLVFFIVSYFVVVCLTRLCCFAVLDRPLLDSAWQQRILRILDIEDRRYNIFIEPDLFASFLLGLVPSSTVKALAKTNKKREFSRRYDTCVFFFIFYFYLCASFVRRYQYHEVEQEQAEADGPVGRGGGHSY